MGLDDRDRFLQIEGVDRHVADIGHLQMLERGGTGGHVVGAQHAALIPDLARTQPCARTVGSSDIHRHAQKTGIEALGAVLHGQAHHACGAAEAGHLVAAERLVETCHGASPVSGSQAGPGRQRPYPRAGTFGEY